MHARALRDDGSVIEGLYAAGNVSAPVMGHTYPGPGGTIGPAMAFGYLAALHIAGKKPECRSISTRRSARSSIRSNSPGPVAISSSTTSGSARAQDPMDKRELRYLVDDTPQVLPTFGNVAQSFHMTEPPSVKFPGIDIELSRVLHASEAVSAPAPIPPSGTGVAVTRFTDIWDKGKAAVIWSETTVTTPDGAPLWTQKRSIFARGEGGFGGERGPSTSSEPPERAPDFELAIPVSPQQALLYRMCGDRNPLHSDPEFAAAAGFPRPILHGLCTYGMTCKAMVDALLDGDTSRVGSYGARFAGVVFPGETLKANVWKEGDGFRGRRHRARARRRGGAWPEWSWFRSESCRLPPIWPDRNPLTSSRLRRSVASAASRSRICGAVSAWL